MVTIVNGIEVQHFYGIDAGCMRAGQDIYNLFCSNLIAGPARAKTVLIEQIQYELAAAYAQGVDSHKPVEMKS